MIRRLLQFVVLSVFRLFRRSVYGAGNISKPPFIIASNHEGYLSSPIIHQIFFSKTKKPIHSIAAVLWYSFIYLRWFQCITQGNAVRQAVEQIKKGHSIFIMPEGRRNYTNKISSFKTGISTIALLTGAPIVPVGIQNSNKFPWFLQAKVNIGKPIKLKKYSKKQIPRQVLIQTTNKIMRIVAILSNKKIKQI